MTNMDSIRRDTLYVFSGNRNIYYLVTEINIARLKRVRMMRDE
jgi:hypothetical protein